MPLIKQQFKVDLFQLKHAKDAGGLLQAIKDDYARNLGLEIVKTMPYEIVEKYDGELPTAVLTRDHKFTETWGVEFVMLKRDEVDRIIKAMKEVDRIGRHDLAMDVLDILNK